MVEIDTISEQRFGKLFCKLEIVLRTRTFQERRVAGGKILLTPGISHVGVLLNLIKL